jgi:hypothetical protein
MPDAESKQDTTDYRQTLIDLINALDRWGLAMTLAQSQPSKQSVEAAKLTVQILDEEVAKAKSALGITTIQIQIPTKHERGNNHTHAS